MRWNVWGRTEEGWRVISANLSQSQAIHGADLRMRQAVQAGERPCFVALPLDQAPDPDLDMPVLRLLEDER